MVETIPRKTSIPRNRSNTPSSSPVDHYKKVVAIPLLDSLIIQMQDWFSDEDRHARHLLHLVPSIIVNNTLEVSETTEFEDMLFLGNDLGEGREGGVLIPFPRKFFFFQIPAQIPQSQPVLLKLKSHSHFSNFFYESQS